MSADKTKEIAHEMECADAAYAVLIERATTHAEKRELKRKIKDLLANLRREIGLK